MEKHNISPELLTLARVSEIMEKGMHLELSEESKNRYKSAGNILTKRWKIRKNLSMV